MEVPTFDQLMIPLFTALRELGGSGSIAELEEKVAEILELSEEVLEVPHNSESSNQSEFQYRLAWARTYLKQYGLIDNSQRGVWVIAPDKRDVKEFDSQEVVRTVREQQRNRRNERANASSGTEEGLGIPDESDAWRENLHRVLTEVLAPDAFERLVQRLLRESGFVHVEVTGRSGDGGIDGKGIAKISGLLSFHVYFQCKRYVGSVSSGHVRDFRGAMVGRPDKGLLITTGTFTRDAIREATRDGAPPLDLINGEELADMLKDLGLGVATKVVEEVSVDEDWFRAI